MKLSRLVSVFCSLAIATALMVSGVVAQERASSVESAEQELRELREQVKNLQEKIHQLEKRQVQLAGQQALVQQVDNQVKEIAEQQKKQAEEAKKAAAKLRFSGYLQGEFIRDTGEGSNRTVEQVRRARLKLDAKPVNFASLTIQGEFAQEEVELKDAYANVLFGERVTLWVGQFKVPFSSQILESSGVRLTPERALVNTRLFPGERDRGAMFNIRLGVERSSPVLSLGSFSGAGPGVDDNNNDKDFLAALHVPTKPWSARLAFYTGQFGAKGAKTDKLRYGLDVQYDCKLWNWQLQFAGGKGDRVKDTISATRIQGWFTQLAYKASRPTTLFVRYQNYDPDTRKGGDTISGPLFGIAIEPERHLRYTIAYENLNRRAVSGRRHVLTARVMVRY